MRIPYKPSGERTFEDLNAQGICDFFHKLLFATVSLAGIMKKTL